MDSVGFEAGGIHPFLFVSSGRNLVTKRLLIFCILAAGLAFGSVFAIGMAEHEYDIDLEWLRYLTVAAITAGCTYYGTRSLTPSE
jgi:hypothetical protein